MLPTNKPKNDGLLVSAGKGAREKSEGPGRGRSLTPTEKREMLVGRELQRGVTPEQINGDHGRGLFREAEVRAVEAETRTVKLAFSSEAPVMRWFGEEVLVHDQTAMRTDRLKNGAALLVNHDMDQQVGVVDSADIGADRVGRAVVRFGQSQKAREIFQDVADGIRRQVSVGYMVHGVDVQEREGQPDLVRVTDWTPYEVSLVSVAADSSVGVGRSTSETPPQDMPGVLGTVSETNNANERGKVMYEKILRDGKGNLVRAKVNEQGEIAEVLEMIERAGEDVEMAKRQGHEAERERTRTIIEMGDQYGAPELARKYVAEGKNQHEFQRALLDELNGNRGESTPLKEAEGSDLGMSEKEVRQYSFIRAVRAMANPQDRRAQEMAAYEYECSQAAAERAGKEPQGILVPSDVLSRTLNTATDGAASGDTGGHSVATDLLASSFIEMLQSRTVAMQLGVTMGGLVGNVDIPRQASGASGYWLGEDDEATLSYLELDQIGLTPKTVAGMSEITRRLLMQSSLDVEALVRRDLAAALALTIDKAVFYGTGSSNQPLGIANTTGINAVDWGGSGSTNAKPTYSELVKMETEIAADDADVSGMAYVLNAAMRGHLKTTERFSGTNGATVWEPGNTVNGYGARVTNQIDNDDVFFGNWADMLIGMWGGLDLTVDPYTHSSRGRIRIVAMQDVDVVLRHVESFCLGRDTE